MIQTTLGIAVSMSGLLAALNLSKPRVDLSDWWLFGWFSATASAMFLFFAAYHMVGVPALTASTLANSSIGCCPPFLYLYARAQSGRPVRRPIIHFSIPVANVVLIGSLGLFGALRVANGAVIADLPAPLSYLIAAIPPLILMASLFYFRGAIRAIDARSARHKELGSSWADVRDLTWVRRWAVASLLGFAAIGGLYGVSLFGHTNLEVHVSLVLLIQTVLIAYVGYSGLRETRYFRMDSGQPTAAPALKSLGLSWTELSDALKSPAILDNPRSRPEDASRILGVPEDALLTMVQQNSDLSFFDLLNQFRVEKAKALLSDPGFDTESVLGVGFEAGFGSKSAFYSAFQKHVGLSPSAYRRSERSKR